MAGAILVVEADMSVRQPLTAYLRDCGYQVFEAINTDEACVILAQPGICVDIVLCDINSPGRFDGFELAQWIRKQASHIDVLLAGSVDRVAKQASALCEAGPHLSKPYHHQTLSDMIKQRLARRDRLLAH